jgi:hypothetical protein
MHIFIARRLCALLASGALTLAVAADGGSASAAGPGPSPETSAAWLTKQLSHGVVHNDQYDFDDYGLTADTGFALAAIQGDSRTLRKITRALGHHVDSWTTGADFGSSDVYAGPTAKALVFAQTVGENARKFGGTNLVKQLRGLVSKSGPTAGRIQDRSASGDFANTIGQSFAALGLANAGDRMARPALMFLLDQQCSKGYFRLDFSDKTQADQSCDAAPSASKAPDTDATALTVLNLLSLAHPSPKARAALGKAVHWLRRVQKDDGSFGGGPSTEASNANSTGLAGWALASADYCPNATRAARWVAKLTVSGDVSGTPLAGEQGAIAYDKAALQTARSSGITDTTRDQFRRATAQAAPVLFYQAKIGCPS